MSILKKERTMITPRERREVHEEEVIRTTIFWPYYMFRDIKLEIECGNNTVRSMIPVFFCMLFGMLSPALPFLFGVSMIEKFFLSTYGIIAYFAFMVWSAIVHDMV